LTLSSQLEQPCETNCPSVNLDV